MPEAPQYAVLGAGRWANRIHKILSNENRRVQLIAGTRPGQRENESKFKSRLTESLSASGAQIAWLCVSPGPHIPLMMGAAMDAGLHVVAEKPWQCSRAVSEMLLAQAKEAHRLAAIHYEYCLLDEVERWRQVFYPGTGLRFGGHYSLNRPDNSGISALENLGSHLLSIRVYAVPKSSVSEIHCCYERTDERYVWLEKDGTAMSSINLLKNREPIIQRFILRFERALDEGGFPFGLDFALRVAEEVAALR